MDFQTVLKEDYVQLSCQGVFSPEALLNVCRAALDTAENEGLKAALIDIRSVRGPGPKGMERYDLGVEFARMQLARGKPVMLALVGAEPIVDPQRFGEIVAQNRGAIARVFANIDIAVAWLEQEIAT